MCDGRRRRRWMYDIKLELGIIFATRGTVFTRPQKAKYCRMRWDNHIWMKDREKDIGANRRGLFYCICIGLNNSSGILGVPQSVCHWTCFMRYLVVSRAKHLCWRLLLHPTFIKCSFTSTFCSFTRWSVILKFLHFSYEIRPFDASVQRIQFVDKLHFYYNNQLFNAV
jgi:hypothetical protein